MHSAQYMLLFLVQFNNSNRFWIYVVTCSYLATRSYELLDVNHTTSTLEYIKHTTLQYTSGEAANTL